MTIKHEVRRGYFRPSVETRIVLPDVKKQIPIAKAETIVVFSSDVVIHKKTVPISELHDVVEKEEVVNKEKINFSVTPGPRQRIKDFFTGRRERYYWVRGGISGGTPQEDDLGRTIRPENPLKLSPLDVRSNGGKRIEVYKPEKRIPVPR